MEINPKQSEGETAVKGSFVLPEETTTEILTNVMVEDGQTIVLAGLFKEKTHLLRSQVPLLGDIPILGELFKKVKDNSTRSELIILITPHIISKSSDTEAAARLDDVNRLAHKARKDITWASRTRRAEDNYSEALRLYDSGDRAGALGHLNGMWEWNRSYLEVERLRERIIKETQPDYQKRIERIMLGQMEAEESKKWYRQLK
jgi:Flp pilus assembly secretin CpaC